jgi:ribose transport system substrate-binding protein
MGDTLKGRGNVGLIFYAADFFVTNERYRAFTQTLHSRYPKIKIVKEQGIAGPDFAGDAERVASAMMIAHRDLNAIWAVWDIPAEGVIAAARDLEHHNLIITTCDLGENVAIDLARNGYVKGIGAQRPFDQGVTEALLAGYGLLGKKAPEYVALPALAVTRSNLLQSWYSVYHEEAPAVIKSQLRTQK